MNGAFLRSERSASCEVTMYAFTPKAGIFLIARTEDRTA